MRNSVTITPSQDRFPAQWCVLLAVIATFAVGLPGPADARSKGRQTVGSEPAVTEPAKTAVATSVVTTSVVATTLAANAVTPASLRAANDLATTRTKVETPTGSIRSKVTVGKASSATTADAVIDPLPSAAPQRPKDWYPESHSYLRPYHYRWRYWTPG
jgi:hypothetical protein